MKGLTIPVNRITGTSSLVFHALDLIVRGANNRPVAVSISAAQELIRVRVVNVCAVAAASPYLYVVVVLVPDDLVLGKDHRSRKKKRKNDACLFYLTLLSDHK